MKLPTLRNPIFPAISTPVLVVLIIALAIYMIARPDKAADNTIIFIATFVAAWAGGAAAFGMERQTREEKERQSKISAANRTFFQISIFYDQFHNIRQYFTDVDNVRDSEYRALNMNSPKPGAMQNIAFDLPGISYFLDADDNISATVIKELLVVEWLYKALMSTVEERAKAWEALKSSVAAVTMPERTPEAIRTVFFNEYLALDQLTTQFVELVDEGARKAVEVDKQMRDALRIQFGTDDFLKVNFEAQQNDTAANTAG